jgi:hypothetical protein
MSLGRISATIQLLLDRHSPTYTGPSDMTLYHRGLAMSKLREWLTQKDASSDPSTQCTFAPFQYSWFPCFNLRVCL